MLGDSDLLLVVCACRRRGGVEQSLVCAALTSELDVSKQKACTRTERVVGVGTKSRVADRELCVDKVKKQT
jgi:hypothetical protein